MRAHTGFFNTSPAKDNKQGDRPGFINTGGEQFTAVAVAYMNVCNKNCLLTSDPSLKKILERFYTLYPEYISDPAYLTSGDTSGLMTNSARRSEKVACMAYTFRQIAVDEIYIKPSNYREIFYGLAPELSKDYLRQPSTKLSVSALRALAQALGITITVLFTDHGKELGKREIYTGKSSLELHIQVQQDQSYFPLVDNTADFRYAGQLAVSPPVTMDNMAQQGTIAEFLDVIAVENKLLLSAFEKIRKNLTGMVARGELSKKLLLELYIEFLPVKSNSSPLSMDKMDKKPVTDLFNVGTEQQIINLLVDALAAGISTDEIKEEQFFNCIENKMMPGIHNCSPY